MNPSGDIAGPLWTNDSLDICGTPSLGISGSSNIVEDYGDYCDAGGTTRPWWTARRERRPPQGARP